MEYHTDLWVDMNQYRALRCWRCDIVLLFLSVCQSIVSWYCI